MRPGRAVAPQVEPEAPSMVHHAQHTHAEYLVEVELAAGGEVICLSPVYLL